MKKLFILALLCCSFNWLFSQTSFRNEWIDYKKTYYRFRVGTFGFNPVNYTAKAGMVRIPQSTLVGAGLGSVPAEQFQLWRNGQELPIYISKPSGTLGSSDYIEFFSPGMDGKLDNDLYRDSSLQLSDYWSLQTDTTTFFLTTNSGNINKRFLPTTNNVVGTNLQPDKNFMYTIGRYFRSYINGGYAAVSNENLYSSSYDKGEGWVSRRVMPVWPLPQFFPNIQLDTTGQAMTVYLNMAGNALNPRFVSLTLNNDSLTTFQMDYFNDKKITIPNIPANSIQNNQAGFWIINKSPNDYDECRISKIELNYPRQFNFNDESFFEFNLAGSVIGRFLKIVHFSAGTSVPVLYDLNNGKRYDADMSNKDTLQFVLDASAQDYHLVLARGDGSTAAYISDLNPRNFIDYTKPNNQGNYIIISNQQIYGSGSSNYLDQYKAYRSSVTGGGFNAKIYDVDELVDQFAYGIKHHPLSIKNFLRFARTNFFETPSYVFLVGKGISYDDYFNNQWDLIADQTNLVPTWGYPGSDNMLSSADNHSPIPLIPIGRLSAVSPAEIGDYLNKVKQYESLQQNTKDQSVLAKAWMKNVIQITGANDNNSGIRIDTFQAQYQRIISDTSFGANVSIFSKSANPQGYPKAVVQFKNIYERGSSLIEYFGHSSSTSLDFGLESPASYNNVGKYPMFIVNGCKAGNIFDFDVNRLNARSTTSERFVLEPNKGAIGYLATSNFGALSYLGLYTGKFFSSIGTTQYGKGIGNIIIEALTQGLNQTGAGDFYGRIHAEQFTFHGDPALKLNTFDKPDYVIDTSSITTSSNYISVADDSVTVKIKIFNIGRATSDSVHLSIKRKFANGDSTLVFNRNIAPVKTEDSVSLVLPLVSNRDRGNMYITAFIDDNLAVPEISDSNNIATQIFYIHDADLRPVFPYNYSIVQSNNISLSASTADPLLPIFQYRMELDTTELFNSTQKIKRTVSSAGGLIQFNNISLSLDSTVYYWRVAKDTSSLYWLNFSFLHQSTGNNGFQQSHFYQHTRSTLDGLTLDSASRKYFFGKNITNIYIEHSIYPTSGLEDNQFSLSVNGTVVSASACIGSSIILNVFDTISLKPLYAPYAGPGSDCNVTRQYNFEYSTQDPGSRKAAMDFLDNVPNGSYVVVRRIYDMGNADWAPTEWAADTAYYGAGNSLYHWFKNQGLQIDSFTYPRTFAFIFRKNDSTHFAPISVFSQGLYDRISFEQNITTLDTSSTITSPLFGPAKSWNTMKWSGDVLNTITNVGVDIIGVNSTKDSLLYSLDSTVHEFNISGISAVDYPYIQLRLHTSDSLGIYPYQLKKWSVEYQPIPEGMMAPNLGVQIPDTLYFKDKVNTAFDTLQGYVVFKNISNSNFLPLNLRLVIYDSLNHADTFALPRTKALVAGDTVQIQFLVNLTNYPEGKYNFYLMANADGEQQEQFLNNNSFYKYIYISRQVVLPVQLLNFTAGPTHTGVLLNWTATNEINFNKYEVEHSANAIEFKNIGSVQALRTGSVLKKYSLIHSTPVSGKNYYRLKMLDMNGFYNYSPVRSVNYGAGDGVQVYPNPFVDKINIQLGQNNSVLHTVKLFNGLGQELQTKSFTGFISLDVQTLASGNYILLLDNGKTIQTFKLQKQH